jgi:molecular chaperone GrpE
MLRRELIRQTRALTSSTFSRPLSIARPRSRTQLSRRSLQPSSFRPLSPRLFQRWQSTDTETKSEDGAPSPEDAKPAEPKDEDPLQKEVEAKNREIIDLKVCRTACGTIFAFLNPSSTPSSLTVVDMTPLQDKYLRSVADFRNLQERTKRDIDSARQFAIQRFAGDLIESIDNLDRALEAVPQDSLTPSEDGDAEAALNKDLINLHAGLKMTESILMDTLRKHGLERFDPVEEGRKFDPRLHEATFMTKVEGKEDGDVFHTQSKGFTLNGRVLRAAKVGVVKNS